MAQREANSTGGRLKRFFKKGGRAQGEGLIAGEERKGPEGDVENGAGEGNDGGKGDGIVR